MPYTIGTITLSPRTKRKRKITTKAICTKKTCRHALRDRYAIKIIKGAYYGKTAKRY